MKYHDWGAFPKRYSEGAQIVGRTYLIGLLRRALATVPEHLDDDALRKWSRQMNPYRKVPYAVYGSDVPALTFKTDAGLHRGSKLKPGSVRTLPLWGDVCEIRQTMFGSPVLWRYGPPTTMKESTDEN